MKILISEVEGYEGECSPTWLNRNQFCNRMDNGTTGFFKLTKKIFCGLITIRTGEEFHGIINQQGNVVNTRISWGR